MKRAALVLFLLVGCSVSSTPLQSEVTYWGVSPGGRIQATVHVTNNTQGEVSPDCMIEVYDADGVMLSADSFQADAALGAGQNDSYNVLTGLEVGENTPTDVRSSCEG